jgi:hypothetical protein
MIHRREAEVDNKRMTATNCCRLGGRGWIISGIQQSIALGKKKEMCKITMNGMKDWNWI